MIEELIGRASWPLAVIVAVIVGALTLGFITSANQNTKRYQACVQAGGSVGVERGKQTCEVD